MNAKDLKAKWRKEEEKDFIREVQNDEIRLSNKETGDAGNENKE